jgi:hypothetical protein
MQVMATMKALFLCGITAVAMGVHLGAAALDVDDCVLNGLKGVNSDAAARMVRQSCENKVASQKRQQILAKYGEGIDANLTHVQWDHYASDDLKVTLKNELPKTVTYVELSISKPKPNGECPYPVSRKYLYEVRAKPGSRLALIVPNGAALVSKEGNLCTTSKALRGREPNILDVSIGAVMPLSDSQLDSINRALDERYAANDPPMHVQSNHGIDFKITADDLRKMACEDEARKNYEKKNGKEFAPVHAKILDGYNCMVRSAK